MYRNQMLAVTFDTRPSGEEERTGPSTRVGLLTEVGLLPTLTGGPTHRGRPTAYSHGQASQRCEGEQAGQRMGQSGAHLQI